jgi:deazaflavin-dependent oxidoreductase (nitroreductase family)
MTVKVPGKGSKGVPFPKFMAKMGNGFVLRRVRSGGMKGAGGTPVFVLHTKGAKSGQDRQVALGYFEEPPDAWLIVASAGGASWNPAWLHNLAKDPNATIEFTGGRRVDVLAETLEGDALTSAWARIAAEAPQYAGYRPKTDREISVVRLRARAAA